MAVRRRGDPKAQAKIFLKMATFGEYLTKLREDREESLAFVGKKIGISANFLSEIERGLKSPSDEVLRSIAEYFGVPEAQLFEMLDRVPLQAREELEGSDKLQKLLLKIRNSNFSDDKKDELYAEVERIFSDMDNEGGE